MEWERRKLDKRHNRKLDVAIFPLLLTLLILFGSTTLIDEQYFEVRLSHEDAVEKK